MSHLPCATCYSENRRGKSLKVTEKDVAYVAELAHLELTTEERQHLLRDLNSILDYMDRLNELDTANVAPMAQVSASHGVSQWQRFDDGSREDILEGLRKSLPHRAAIENAPNSDGTFFKVPKVIER
jgi:aspartyl-tRNA(Asn)/glutamyl-tRNA(Gln) amidotransferase subunit C